MESLSGVRLIWPSDTASKAPAWYTTALMVLGKAADLTRLSTTAATATLPT